MRKEIKQLFPLTPDNFLSHRGTNFARQIPVGFNGFELRELLLHVVRSAKKKSDVGFGQHRRIVERIAGGDDVIVQQLERSDGALFLFRDTKLVIHDAVVLDDEPMTQKSWPAELTQKWGCELLKR